MEQDFFTNVPTEIMIDMFLRLPVESIMTCKCVCKSWRDLIKTREFVESHFSRSVLCLALNTILLSKTHKFVEFLDTQSAGQNRYCKTILNFSFPHEAMIRSSANGLLFLSSNNHARYVFICNPINHEYLKLPSPVGPSVIEDYGFGVSKLSGECKVVRLFCEDNHRTTPRKCEVYSLRRGSWRSVESSGDQLLHCQGMSVPISLNGNLHWLVRLYSDNQYRRILCFDLETECYSTFSIPHLRYRNICLLRVTLCLCDSSKDGFVIWLMKEYGDDKSWKKEFVIKIRVPCYLRSDVVPIKVFKDCDINATNSKHYELQVCLKIMALFD